MALCRITWRRRSRKRSSKSNRIPPARGFSFIAEKKERTMKSVWKLCAILFLATALVGQTSTAAKPKKAKPATITAADVQALKDAIAAQQAAIAQQQQQIQALRDEL